MLPEYDRLMDALILLFVCAIAVALCGCQSAGGAKTVVHNGSGTVEIHFNHGTTVDKEIGVDTAADVDSGML